MMILGRIRMSLKKDCGPLSFPIEGERLCEITRKSKQEKCVLLHVLH